MFYNYNFNGLNLPLGILLDKNEVLNLILYYSSSDSKLNEAYRLKDDLKLNVDVKKLKKIK